MHTETLQHWQHSHTFGQDEQRAGERRTLIVIAITAVMMVVEIATGIMFGSMALLADGLHMASHTAALGISAFAYIYARRHARDASFSFGTGKINALGGFTGAVLLAVFALIMAWESLARMTDPVAIAFDQAIAVAVLGLLVNGASVLILGSEHEGHHHRHDVDHDHDHDHDAHDHRHALSHDHHGDHNLRAAYLHVLADALTSLLAIFALLAGKFLGLIWMDPLMGVIGALLVARWSWGLLRTTSAVLVDRQGPETIRHAIRTSIEDSGEDRVSDLHLWSIGPDLHAVAIALVTHDAALSPDDVKRKLPSGLGLAHVTVEIHRCPH
ncbi:CDF family Co(II)/Ni(II) efflux transporter DmeF [Thiocystis violascens]|uniref:Cation diffusion facilitator family transporter n=1 Tax=Thiocystis violascens (strain ATCC 17096 / DSM 198 / 6111) TaxID=765911 RepID=I3YG67_THIV6|nr:CDF family Co(II)/Ni(II) efflux transporter DmeF [Thiocystis violascens]AFL75985.1 cation diffusion facilitator family transporter [Thiocystis violascens DSM 198]